MENLDINIFQASNIFHGSNIALKVFILKIEVTIIELSIRKIWNPVTNPLLLPLTCQEIGCSEIA